MARVSIPSPSAAPRPPLPSSVRTPQWQLVRMLTESSMTSPAPYPVKCFRDKKWVKIQTDALLHVDLMAMLFLLVSFLSLSPCQPKYRRVALVRIMSAISSLPAGKLLAAVKDTSQAILTMLKDYDATHNVCSR